MSIDSIYMYPPSWQEAITKFDQALELKKVCISDSKNVVARDSWGTFFNHLSLLNDTDECSQGQKNPETHALFMEQGADPERVRSRLKVLLTKEKSLSTESILSPKIYRLGLAVDFISYVSEELEGRRKVRNENKRLQRVHKITERSSGKSRTIELSGPRPALALLASARNDYDFCYFCTKLRSSEMCCDFHSSSNRKLNGGEAEASYRKVSSYYTTIITKYSSNNGIKLEKELRVAVVYKLVRELTEFEQARKQVRGILEAHVLKVQSYDWCDNSLRLFDSADVALRRYHPSILGDLSGIGSNEKLKEHVFRVFGWNGTKERDMLRDMGVHHTFKVLEQASYFQFVKILAKSSKKL